MSQYPDIQKNSDGGISDFGISGQSLIKENCHNSRTNDDIDMKLGPVTKLEKRNKTTSKKLTITSYQKIVTSLSFFRFMANLEKSAIRNPEAWSVKLLFLLTITFYLTKTENRTKKSIRKF